MKGGSTSRGLSRESAEGLRHFFAWLEGRFGGLPMDTGRCAEVITSERFLRASDLERLFRHEATALHVRQFFPHGASRTLGRQLAQQVQAGQGQNWKVSTSRGLESSDVATLGAHPPFNVASASGKAQDVDAYFSAVQEEFQSRRNLRNDDDSEKGSQQQQPSLWPLDLLRLHLDEIWPSGAGLARENDKKGGRPFSGGLPRIMEGPTRWRKGHIHVDEMGPLQARQGLFSANIYLQLPDTDPETADSAVDDGVDASAQDLLHVWPVGIRSRWDWYRNALLLSGLSSQDAENQARLRVALGPPLTIRATPGDLVLLCVQRPHAAIGFASGIRVSLQCFLQYQGPEERVLIDS
jgi:hypothetical protein